jgi:hypothetical protein
VKSALNSSKFHGHENENGQNMNNGKTEINREVFGTRSPSVTEIKKLTVKKIIALATYLKFDIPDQIQKTDVKNMREYCVKNLYRLQGLSEDVSAALSIAHRALSARIGEYKKLLKTLIRVVNETFGAWSIRFKIHFVISGLLNFSEHFHNIHENCSRFIWWTQCCSTGEGDYHPAQDYINEMSSGRGMRCNELISSFFKNLVTAFTLSGYMEGLLGKCILYSKTTIYESYFHWVGIMIPKWQNVTKMEYILRESSAYIAFEKRQDDKFLFTKKLRQHKYASTLVGTAGQKNGRVERYMMEAHMSVCSQDLSVKAAVNMNLEKIEKKRTLRREKLQQLYRIFEDDTTAQNLKMGPIKHEFRTAGEDGVLAGKQLSEYVKSARPVLPFPFMKENLLITEDDENRLSNVWAFSRSIKIQRNEENDASLICAICGTHYIVSDILLRCSTCLSAVIHESCITTHNTGWHQDENEVICKGCILISALE